ncbi:coproporphyrinogen-III oxidase family protein [Streptomyces nigra]|uniref:coproporphyrinogen-III oxidase family protein n=1 Tax=Streptomyces nigra TaxID=1827580 RepID=UPI0036CA19FA
MNDAVPSDIWAKKDNEFIAWYPLILNAQEKSAVWSPSPAGYYVHIPFCTAICDYCGFAVERSKGAHIARYMEALSTEIRRYADAGRLTGHRFVCGHFGGGTPSAIDAEDLISVKRLIDSCSDVSSDAEVTVEVNPISFTSEKAEVYAEGGINRISIGVQSFDNQVLRTIGRPHRAGDVEDAINVVHAAGFDNFSLDIIYGVPGQSVDCLREDLTRAAATGASHLSCFRLEIIPFTALKLREGAGLLPSRLDESQLNEMDDVVREVLIDLGYEEYGAFNFAKRGYRSVHNRVAFVAPQCDYVGFGLSSYSFMNGYIYCNHADLLNYEKEIFAGRDPIALAHQATSMELMSRYFVLGVKFQRVPRAGFIERFGVEPENVFGPVFKELSDRGVLKRDGDDYIVTSKGRRYINNICKSFYVGDNRGKIQYPQFVSNLSAEQVLSYAKKASA